jgi:tetratricopeptide (TPR) repeat protein
MNTPDFEQDPELMNYLTLDGRPGPAARLSKERALAMVGAALEELPVSAGKPTRSGGDATRMLLVAAAVLLGIVGGAAAARWYFSDPEPAVEVPRQPPSAAAAAHSVPAPTREPTIVEAVELGTPGPIAAAAALSEPSERARTSERGAPEDLLQKANRLRTVGKFRESALTYTTVSDRYPKTLSAYVAQVAAASIELEHLGRPARARKLFERALREHPEGALDLEARQGLATALRDLGETEAEIDVLRALIELHNGSPAARRAGVRLKELGNATSATP